MNNLDRHCYPTLERRMKDGSVNGLNLIAFRRQTFHQPAHWLHLAHQRQRNGKLKKQDKKSSATEEWVVALIQNAEQSRVPSPSRPDIQIGQVSPPDSRIRYYEHEQEREMSVWDAENEL